MANEDFSNGLARIVGLAFLVFLVLAGGSGVVYAFGDNGESLWADVLTGAFGGIVAISSLYSIKGVVESIGSGE